MTDLPATLDVLAYCIPNPTNVQEARAHRCRAARFGGVRPCGSDPVARPSRGPSAGTPAQPGTSSCRRNGRQRSHLRGGHHGVRPAGSDPFRNVIAAKAAIHAPPRPPFRGDLGRGPGLRWGRLWSRSRASLASGAGMASLGGGARLVEPEQALQDLLVGEAGGPAVGRGDGRGGRWAWSSQASIRRVPIARQRDCTEPTSPQAAAAASASTCGARRRSWPGRWRRDGRGGRGRRLSAPRAAQRFCPERRSARCQ